MPPKVNILFVCPYVPTRIRTRPRNFIRQLARRGHRLTLATLWETAEERESLDALAGWGVRICARGLDRGRILRNLVAAGFSGVPFQARYSWSPRLSADLLALFRTGESFDVVHVEHLRGAVFGEAIRSQFASTGRPVPIIWDSVDSISHLFAQSARISASAFGRLSGWMELPRTRRHEARLVRTFDQVLVTSQADRQAFLDLDYGGSPPDPAHITVIPNGVDPEEFPPGDGKYNPDTIVFTGKMSYHANITAAVYFAREILPRVWRSRPQAQFWIVGKDPVRKIQALGSDDRIRVFGTVPAIAPVLSSAGVSVAPMRYGAGIQNKVLEAMACGVPVVCSAQAAAALSAKDQTELLLAGNPGDFADAVIKLLEDRALRQRIARAGREYVLINHHWESIISRLESLFYEIIQPFD